MSASSIPSGEALAAHRAEGFANAAQAAQLVGNALEGLDGELVEALPPGMFTTLGKIDFAVGENDKAIEVLSRALALAPDDVTALAMRGQAYAKVGDNPRALDDFDRVAALAPDDPEHHVARAKPLALLGRMKEAVEAASRTIALAPDHLLAHRLRAVYRSHVDASAEGQAAVTADLRRVWELSPRTAVYCKEYVERLMDCGDADTAVAVLDQALALEPSSAELYYERGSCKNRRHEVLYAQDIEDHESPAQAIARSTSAHADIEKALALGKRDEDTYWELLRAREGMKDQAAYLAEIDRVIKALPDFVMALSLRHSWRSILKDEEGAAADRTRLLALGFQFPDD